MSSSPARLNKVEKTRFELFCERICPYLLVICIIILLTLIFIAIAKYGSHIAGSESNGYYYHMDI